MGNLRESKIKRYGQELPSESAWSKLSVKYTKVLSDKYHTHRLSVIDHIIPKELYERGKVLFDFGCGDAIHFDQFLSNGVQISGIDISKEMVQIGKDRLSKAGHDPQSIEVGDVYSLAKVPSSSLDAVFCFNVLAYLTRKEESEFYHQLSRILKPSGYFVVTHSNELFDMYALNIHTTTFFQSHFLRKDLNPEGIDDLLKYPGEAGKPTTFNIRENPLSYQYKLKEFGLNEVQQEFINYHEAPPKLIGEQDFISTLNIDESDKWKLMFMCSSFASLAVLNRDNSK